MTLAIGLVNPEGVVIAADSRQTGGAGRVASDNAIKVFDLTDTVVAATSGYAFLRPQNAVSPQSIASLVEEFKPSIVAGATVLDVAVALHAYFDAIYAQHIVHFPGNAVGAGQIALSFVVGGYDPGSRTGVIFACEVPGVAPVNPVRDSNAAGTWWIGQSDVVARIFNGFDPRIGNLALPAGTALPTLAPLMYNVHFAFMTLQDSVDFVTGLIQITITIQRFADGIAMEPGGTSGVGGPIDVAVIRPGSRVTWIARKGLHP